MRLIVLLKNTPQLTNKCYWKTAITFILIMAKMAS